MKSGKSPYASKSLMKTSFGFFLSALSDKTKGVVYTCTRISGKVIDRQSTGIVVQKKYWKNPKVTNRHPDHLEINSRLQRILDSGPRSEGSDYKSCLLEYFNWYIEDRYRKGIMENTTHKTYHKIRKVIKRGIHREFKSDTFPFEWLRDKEALRKLEDVIRRDVSGRQFRAKRTASNYLSVLKSVVGNWAESMDVNDLGRFNRLRIDWSRLEVSKARVLTDEELNKLREYQPSRAAINQNFAKSMFLFSIASSGQRVVDVITLRTTNFKPGFKILYKVKKTKNDYEVDFNYEMMEALSLVYPDLYEEACSSVKVSNTRVGIEDMYKLVSQEGFVENIGVLNLLEINIYIKRLMQYGWDKEPRFKEFWSAVVELIFEMRDEASKLFFNKVRQLPGQFVYPFLDEKDFVGANWDKNFMSRKQTDIVYNAIPKYNRSLDRIAKAIDVPSFSSHSARHTFAKQLKDMDFTYDQIQQSLNHASLKSTKEYIDTRFDNGVAKNVAKARYQKRRSL
jgi:integrase